MLAELRDLLLIDIETVACEASYSQLSERLRAHWSRKSSFLKREEGDTDEDLFHQKAGIYAEFGKIIVVAVGRYVEVAGGKTGLQTKCFYSDDERSLLEEVRAFLDHGSATLKLVAHNGKEFDFPYLSRRMLIHGMSLPAALNLSGRKPWEVPHLDTLELWKFGDYKHFTSLDLLATVFDIPSSKNDMDGSMVNHVYYHENGLRRIAQYCVSDVVVLAQLFLRMKGHPLMEEAGIVKCEI
ncbi:MAG: 3'-5' exonuclease [Cyclobacteriaceae bacterium]|nr:3'-5' exonuclease [Cyclobacteriaceae bacterium]